MILFASPRDFARASDHVPDSSDAADSGRIDPFGVSTAEVGGGWRAGILSVTSPVLRAPARSETACARCSVAVAVRAAAWRERRAESPASSPLRSCRQRPSRTRRRCPCRCRTAFVGRPAVARQIDHEALDHVVADVARLKELPHIEQVAGESRLQPLDYLMPRISIHVLKRSRISNQALGLSQERAEKAA